MVLTIIILCHATESTDNRVRHRRFPKSQHNIVFLRNTSRSFFKLKFYHLLQYYLIIIVYYFKYQNEYNSEVFDTEVFVDP